MTNWIYFGHHRNRYFVTDPQGHEVGVFKNKPDAVLAATAPELLDALVRVDAIFGNLKVDDLSPHVGNPAVVEMIQSLELAREVIKRARGG